MKSGEDNKRKRGWLIMVLLVKMKKGEVQPPQICIKNLRIFKYFSFDCFFFSIKNILGYRYIYI